MIDRAPMAKQALAARRPGAKRIARRGMRVAVDAAARVHQVRCARRAAQQLDAIGTGGRPVVVGPWTSEVGFELLYWVPLLRWALARRAVDPQQVTVITRGGAHCWYRDFATHTVELFDLLHPAGFRRLNEQRASAAGGQKQIVLSEMDVEILRRAGGLLDPAAELVHPSLLHQAFRYYWSGRVGPKSVTSRQCFARLKPGGHHAIGGLPPRYVAVKAYHSDAFPETAENRRFVTELLRRLSARRPVVLLSAGVAVDDHADVAAGAERDVILASELFDVRDNLQAQTAIVAGADALVSSYGGFSYLGPFTGVLSMAFASTRNDNPLHLQIVRHAARQLGVAPFVVCDTSDPRTLDRLLAGVAGAPA